MRKNFVSVANARKGEYKKVIKEITKTGKCPFCKENFKYHKKPLLKNRGGWFLTENSWPYKETRHHLIIIGKKHKENFLELKNKDFTDVAYLTNWAIRKYKIKGGGFTMRFGDPRINGSSVSHIHFHIIAPKSKKRILFPIGP